MYRKLDMVSEISLSPGRNFRDSLHYINKRVDILKTASYETERPNTHYLVMLKCLAKVEKFSEKEADFLVHVMPNSRFGWVLFCF